MEILENKDEWLETYQSGWKAHHQRTGEINWELYQHPRNRQTPGRKGVKLSQGRLLFISSAGGYLKDSQHPFDAAAPYGDYSIRKIPVTAHPDALCYAHDHYDHTMIEQDMQVAIPLAHLAELVEQNVIGSLAPEFISFMGYHPNSARVVADVVPPIVEYATQVKADSALLAPL